jgi:amino acid transporter
LHWYLQENFDGLTLSYTLQARLNQEIARQGFLPFSKLLSSSRPFNAPMGGLIVHFIPSLIVITVPSKDVYSFILNVEGYPAQYISLALSIGVIWLRYKRPDLKRPFKAWIPGVLVRILLSLALLAAPFFPPATPSGGSLFYRSLYAFVGTAM